ncbi:MAG: hypothetical protein U9R37_02355 [Campylobacterota bacterium]|nr:hypothetical protein [Campylobacterota bacterium]
MKSLFIREKCWDDYIGMLDAFGHESEHEVWEANGGAKELRICTDVLDDAVIEELDNCIFCSNDTSCLADFITAKNYDYIILWR